MHACMHASIAICYANKKKGAVKFDGKKETKINVPSVVENTTYTSRVLLHEWSVWKCYAYNLHAYII